MVPRKERPAEEGAQYLHALHTILDLREEVKALAQKLHEAKPVLDAAPLDSNGRHLYLGCRVLAESREGRIQDLGPTESWVVAVEESGEDRFDNCELVRIET